jgi:RNA polymerase primary sigma factor
MYARTIIRIAYVFSSRYNTDIEEDIQNGSIGLIYALTRFDPSEHISLPRYIAYPILSNIQRKANFMPTSLFYFPAFFQDQLYNIFEMINEHQCQLCFWIDKADCKDLINQVTLKLNCTTEEAIFCLSFFKEYDYDYDFSSVLDDNISANQVELAEQADLKRILNETLSEIKPNREQVLRMRFGLDEDNPAYYLNLENHTDKQITNMDAFMSLNEIGEILGVTRERVRQIESKAFKDLNKPVIMNKLRQLTDGYL